MLAANVSNSAWTRYQYLHAPYAYILYSAQAVLIESPIIEI